MEALADLENAIAIQPTVAKSLATERGLLLTYLGRNEEAIAIYVRNVTGEGDG